MKRTKTKIAFADMPKTYRELMLMHLPRPLHDPVDHENALEVVMAMAGHKLTKDQDDYVEIMSELIEKYEREHVAPPPRSTPLERLKFLVEQAGMSASDLGRLLGSRGLGSVLLTGRRELSKSHIRTLSQHFHVGAGYFV